MIGIYKITNKVNKKIYIGQSTDCHRRWLEHLRSGQPEKYCKKSERDSKTPIHLAMQKYGVNNFSIEILEECLKNQLDEKEKYWIKYYKDLGFILYNLTDGGQESSLVQKGEKHSQAKLTQKEVDKIKYLLKNTDKNYNEILKEFPKISSKAIISLINQGKNWYDENEQYPIRKSHKRQCGEESKVALFTNKQVMEIRKEYANDEKITARFLAEKYNISLNTMRAILQGKSYKYLPYFKKSINQWIEPCIDYPQSLK